MLRKVSPSPNGRRTSRLAVNTTWHLRTSVVREWVCARVRVRAHFCGIACAPIPSPPHPLPSPSVTLPPRVLVCVFVVCARMCFWVCMCMCVAHCKRCSLAVWGLGWGWFVSAVAELRWAARKQLWHSEVYCAPIHALSTQSCVGRECGAATAGRRHTCPPAYACCAARTRPVRTSTLPRHSISVLLRISSLACNHPNARRAGPTYQHAACDDAMPDANATLVALGLWVR